MAAAAAYRIPFNRTSASGAELSHVKETVERGNLGGDGVYSKKCADFLRDYLRSGEVLLTGSCTAALEIAVEACGIGDGDEVIVPSFTYVSTANAIVRSGALPVWVDIVPQTLCLSAELVRQAITPRTRAILPVHYGGVPCDMTALRQLAAEHDLLIIEDAAAAFGSLHQGQHIGSLGHMACFSFHETKNISCGQGGALCINQPELLEKARIIRDRGTNRHAFDRGKVDRYTWVGKGSAYGLSELAAAFLWGQLERLQEIAHRRAELYHRYAAALESLVADQRFQLLTCKRGDTPNHHTFALITDHRDTRNQLIWHLRSRGILATTHYVPLHTSSMGRTLPGHDRPLPVTESVSERLVRLPLFESLSEAQQDEVIDAVTDFYASSSMTPVPLSTRCAPRT